ncbi:MAG: DUF2911 domain-containing protein [Saprospiraceae bacterium]|nr:DUF2911 domain-containing protein [Saprospiraceae bacterium]
MIKRYSMLLSAMLFVAFSVHAQIKTPAPSPVGKISQELGLGKVEVEYSRPSAKNRTVYGDLVPYGAMWRTGANASTKINFTEDVNFGGVPVPKGNYALYTTPGKNEWEVILYKNTTFWGTPDKDFSEADVAARVKAASKNVKDFVETFTINIGNITNNSADLQLVWENTSVSVPMTFDVDTKVMADIKAQMEGPSAGVFYQSARYYYEEKKDMNTALGWINTAIEKGGEKFWYLRLKANILAELKRYPEAISTAERSTEIARSEGNADYPRMNDKSIAEWKTKMK